MLVYVWAHFITNYIHLWHTVHTDVQCYFTLVPVFAIYFGFYVKSHGVYFSLYVLPSVCHVTVNIADYSRFYSWTDLML